MYEVIPINFGQSATRVWISREAIEKLRKSRKKGIPSGRFLKTLQRCAQSGFELYERSEPPIVKHEWEGVYRFGIRSELFRLIGFYGESKAEFIVIDCFLKRGQQLGAPERDAIDHVAAVKRTGFWKKVFDEQHPRLVE